MDEAGGAIIKLADLGSAVPPLRGAQIRWSPDLSRLAVSGEEEGGPVESRARIWIIELETKKTYPVTAGPHDTDASWSDSEHVLFSRGFSPDEAGVCCVSLKSRAVDCLTSGNADFSPWFSLSRSEIFLARGPAKSRVTGRGFLTGFHVWKLKSKK